MTRLIALEEAVADLEQVDRHFSPVVSREGHDWRRTLVKSRRELADATGKAFLAITDYSSSHELPSTQLEELRQSLSDFRHHLALHQASYPASSIDETPEYKKSSNRVQDTLLVFVTAARRICSEHK